jgi:RNA polymerase sigma-70 factor (ECF subfamily)
LDWDLLAQAQSGNRDALSVVARELLPRVRNLVRYLVRGDADVDDVAQEALIAVLRGLPSYEGEGTFYSWSDRVIARATFAWMRRERQRRKVVRAPMELETPTCPAGLPDEYVGRRRLVEALDQLPAEQRYVLVLHHVLGITVPEIAQEIHAPAETVRTRLRTGRNRLRTLVDRDHSRQEISDDET